MQIQLDKVSAAVLLRCLTYGENAISQQEERNGVANILRKNIENIRRQVNIGLYKKIIVEENQNNKGSLVTSKSTVL